MPPSQKKTTNDNGPAGTPGTPTSVSATDTNKVAKKTQRKRGGPKRPYKKLDMDVLKKHVETFTKRVSLSEKRLNDALLRSSNARKKFDYHNGKLTGYSAELEFRETCPALSDNHE